MWIALSLTRPPRARLLLPAVPRAAVPAPRAAVALPQWRAFSDVVEKDVVVPETVDTLEWVLDSPPPLHQFEESPIVVEVAVSYKSGLRRALIHTTYGRTVCCQGYPERIPLEGAE